MADAVGLWVIVYFCVTSVNTKDTFSGDPFASSIISSHNII